MREINEAGLELIRKYEGLRLNIYNDIAGYPSIGIGHRIRSGEDFSNGITDQQAVELLKTDLNRAYRSIYSLVKVSLTNNQYAALCSFTFNLGGGALQRSTLLRKVNRGDSINGEFEKWCFAGKPPKKSPGLLRRRYAEAELYAL